MKTGFAAYFAAYVGLVIGAGLLFSRRMKSLADFFLAARELPGGLVFLALTSSWFGATSILVATDRAYADGLSSFWIMGVPAVATILFLAVFAAGPLRRFDAMSLPDLFELRYGRLVRHLAAILIILYMVLLAASQLVALGRFLGTFLGLSYLGSLAVSMAVVLAYSAVGGLRSVVFTDAVKLPLLAAGVGGLALFLAGRLAGAGGVAAAFAAAPAGTSGYFNVLHGAGENILIALSFAAAWTISPIALQRIQAARSLAAARRGLFGAAGALFCLYTAVVVIGILAARLFDGRPLSGPLVSEIIAAHAGPALGGILFVAVLGAVLSTMDTAVNTGALSLARDVFQQASPLARRKPVLAGRLATVVVGVLAFAIAARLQDILKTIGLSSEIMAEGLFVPGIAMIFSTRRAPLAGLLSLVLGGGFAVLCFLGATGLLSLGLPVWPRSVPWGMGLSLLGYAIGSISAIIQIMSLRERLRWWFIDHLGRPIVRLWIRTNRFTLLGEDAYKRARAAGKPVVFLVWHGKIFLVPWFFRKRGIMPLISPSRDGEIPARIMDGWGYKILRGSGTHFVRNAWLEMIRELRAGGEVIIVPDGPRGPDREFKPGAVRLAAETGAVLVPFAFTATRRRILRSWDRFLLPLPFGRITAAYGEPVEIPRDLPPAEQEAQRARLEALLREFDAKIDALS